MSSWTPSRTISPSIRWRISCGNGAPSQNRCTGACGNGEDGSEKDEQTAAADLSKVATNTGRKGSAVGSKWHGPVSLRREEPWAASVDAGAVAGYGLGQRPYDSVLRIFETWAVGYDKGEVVATRKFLTKSIQQVVWPVQFRHDVPVQLIEMNHLFRTLEAEKPDEKTTVNLRRLLAIMRNPALWKRNEKFMKRVADERFIVSMVFRIG